MRHPTDNEQIYLKRLYGYQKKAFKDALAAMVLLFACLILGCGRRCKSSGESGKVKPLREELLDWVARNLGERNDPILYQLARSEELRGKPFPFL